MKILLKPEILVVVIQADDDHPQITRWIRDHKGHAFTLETSDERNFCLKDLGPREEACREPINVVSTSGTESVRLISNFAFTPFVLDDRHYASVEGFWHGLKFPEDADRLRLSGLHGPDAKREGSKATSSETFTHAGRVIRTGSPDHWQLMYDACWAKFSQHIEARQALLSTGSRPLTHRVRHDSKVIPGVIMADIWMRIRERLKKTGMS